MTTTVTRAKALRPVIEHFVTKARKQEIGNLRFLLGRLSKISAMKLYHEIGAKYQSRKGGYTRIVKLGQFRSDGAQKAIIEFV